jgi:hypothetical protein
MRPQPVTFVAGRLRVEGMHNSGEIMNRVERRRHEVEQRVVRREPGQLYVAP